CTTAAPVIASAQRYKIEAPPGSPAWLGSPASLDALGLNPTVSPCRLKISWARTKSSLGGGGGRRTVQLKTNGPVACPAAGPIPTQYVMPWRTSVRRAEPSEAYGQVTATGTRTTVWVGEAP